MEPSVEAGGFHLKNPMNHQIGATYHVLSWYSRSQNLEDDCPPTPKPSE